MLLAFAFPVLIKAHSGRYEEMVLRMLKKPFLPKGTGPEGWNRAVLKILEKLENEK